MKVKDLLKRIVPIVIVTIVVTVVVTSIVVKNKVQNSTIKVPSNNVGIVKVYDAESKTIKEFEGKIFISEIGDKEQDAISVEMGDAKQISETKYNYIGTK